MSNKKPFKASNGWTAEKGSGVLHEVRNEYGSFVHSIGPNALETLAEYTQHERDKELGRTRWPKYPDYVIYRNESEDDSAGRCVRVINEQTGRTAEIWENGRSIGNPTPHHWAAADWYFTEGPGKEPERPWENAKAGEVWRLTVDGLECNHVKMLTTFSGGAYKVTPDYTGITAGQKLLNADGSLADDRKQPPQKEQK